MEENVEWEDTESSSDEEMSAREAIEAWKQEHGTYEGLPHTLSDFLAWNHYDTTEAKEPFGQWLHNNLPSNIEIKDGVSWIYVTNPHIEDRFEKLASVNGLLESWEHWLQAGKPVNYQTIKQLALNSNIRTGKWLLFAESGGKIDHLWSIIATGIVTNQLPCTGAKVSTYDSTQNSHVVCIYNDDFTNMDEVMQSEQAIRNIGIKGRLMYKPDAYTYTSIYKRNKWKLAPFIYESVYDILKGASVIKTVDGVF